MQPLKEMFDDEFFNYIHAAIAEILGPEAALTVIHTREKPGWAALELNERVHQLANSLHGALGGDFLKSHSSFLKLIRHIKGKSKYHQGYALMFLPNYLQCWGLDNCDLALDIIEELTQLVSCEFAIRPLLISNQQTVLARMLDWTQHPSAAVRRLASEGCRPRLPWGLALKPLIANPGPIFPILTALKEDDSLYVRKSVANNLNDISKDHADMVLAWAAQHKGLHQHSDWIINHGLRTLLKAGEPKALNLMGWYAPKAVQANITAQTTITYGQKLEALLDLILDQPIEKARVEIKVGFYRPTGITEKVFMLSKTQLNAGHHQFRWGYHFQDLSTRKHHDGPHTFALILNGQTVATTTIQLSRS